MLHPTHCRCRQQRLLQRLEEEKLDAVVCGLPQHVYYLTGHWTHWLQHSAAVLFCDGRVWLSSASQPDEHAAADERACYDANPLGTQRQEQPSLLGEQVLETLTKHRATNVGVDTSLVSAQVASALESCQPIDPELWQLRRCKDPDELELMQVAIRCCEAMFRRARQIIEPGVPELEVFAALHAEAVRTAGEPLSALLGNDFACGLAGGPPRKDRRTRAGELYILDLGPAYRGYFSDNCRTFSVDRKPTDAQRAAWEAVAACHTIIQRMARPGVRCRDLFTAVDNHLRHNGGAGMVHHLGHGVGLQPHEYPHLNPKWDDVLREGEVFTAEPGRYAPELAAGIRLENQYLVTSTGVKSLIDFPMEL